MSDEHHHDSDHDFGHAHHSGFGGGDEHLAGDPLSAQLAAHLDELAEAERLAAPAGLEDRLFASVRTAAEVPPLRYVPSEAPVVAARARSRWRAPLPLAAAIAVLATVGAVWLTQPVKSSGGATSVVALEQDVNDWLALPGVVDLAFDAEVEAISSETARLDTDFPDDAFFGDSGLDEGAL